MKRCINCSWEGEESLLKKGFCPVCGDWVKDTDHTHKAPAQEVKPELDFNADGKVDAEDVKLGAKLLGKQAKKKTGGKK